MRLSEIMDFYRRRFEEGVLCYIKCTECSYCFYYPRDGCPHCGSINLTLLESKGRGSVFSFTRVHRKSVPDAVYAIVELDEGFRMYTNLVDSSEVQIGSPVVAVMRETGRGKMPFFKTLSGPVSPQ